MNYHSSFGTSEDYHELNSGPHRRGIVRLAAPALTWHLCFWVPNLASSRIDTVEQVRGSARNDVDRFILELYRQLRDKAAVEVVRGVEISSIVSGHLILFNGVYDAATLEHLPGIRRGTRFGTPTNYVPPLTARQADLFESVYRDILITFGWKNSEISIRIELNTEYFTISMLAGLARDNSKIVELHEVLGVESDACPREGKTKQKCTDELRDHLYLRFWDTFKTTFFESEQLRWIHTSGGSPFGHAFADFRGLVLSSETKGFSSTEGDWGPAAVGHFIPVLASSDAYEIAANHMLGKRALYMSTLGPQDPTQDVAVRIPVFFLIYATPAVRRFELGRLLLAIHHLGSLRLASLRRLKNLTDAGRILSHLEPVAQEARAHIAGEKSDEAMRKIEEANKLFNSINKLETAILYRIERSRYYVNQFGKTVPILGIDPIEGFQQYDKFVQRRMGAALDYIDRLGTRYERATTNLSLLQQYYLAIRANMIAAGGEALLFLVLIPYYLTALLHYLIGEKSIPVAFVSALILIGYGSRKYFKARLAVVAAPAMLLVLPLMIGGAEKRACFDKSFVDAAQCYLSPPVHEVAVVAPASTSRAK